MNERIIELENNYFSIKLNNSNSYVIYHSFMGEPFIVTKDDYNEIVEKGFSGAIAVDDVDLSNNVTQKSKLLIDKYIDTYDHPEVLDLIVSEQCNLMCHMCSHALSLEISETRQQKRSMDLEVAKKWIDWYVKLVETNDMPIYSFHFGAAEPLIYKKALWSIVEYIDSVVDYRPVEYFLNSNLTLLDDDDICMLSKYKIRVAVGLDGLKSQNDSIRIFKSDKKGTFDIIIDSIRKLLAANISVGVNITLTDNNFYDVDANEIIKYFKNVGINTILVDSDFVNHINVPGEEIVQKLMDFERTSKDYGIEILGSWKTPFNMLTCENSDVPKSFCYSTVGKNITITPNGYLTFCTYSSLLFNEVTETKQAYEEFRVKMKSIMQQCLPGKRENCSGCPIEGLCSGGCQLAHEQNGNGNYMCDIYLEALYQLAQYHFQNL